uniref:hypothetical protein n=1 Tax=Klebsiella pneumoniae TaxID=573 RepID=UPI0025A0A996
HFTRTPSTPRLRVSGTLRFDDFALDNPQRQPLLALKRGSIQLTDVEPLASRYDFGALQLDGAELWYTQ